MFGISTRPATFWLFRFVTVPRRFTRLVGLTNGVTCASGSFTDISPVLPIGGISPSFLLTCDFWKKLLADTGLCSVMSISSSSVSITLSGTSVTFITLRFTRSLRASLVNLVGGFKSFAATRISLVGTWSVAGFALIREVRNAAANPHPTATTIRIKFFCFTLSPRVGCVPRRPSRTEWSAARHVGMDARFDRPPAGFGGPATRRWRVLESQPGSDPSVRSVHRAMNPRTNWGGRKP